MSRAKLINALSNTRESYWKPESRDIPVKKFVGGKRKRKRIDRLSDNKFFNSKEWRLLRVRVLEKYGCSCMMCGESPKLNRIILHVDHIKPRSRYPELALRFDNLQVLCEACNIGKGNKYTTDYRPDERVELDIVRESNKHI